MKKLFLGLLLVFGATFTFISCDKEDDETPKNIVELASSNSNLSILVEAVNHAGLGSVLSGSSKLTVFAPSNDAFNALLKDLKVAKITDLDKKLVERILLYHVVAGEVKSTDLSNGYVKTQAKFGSSANQLSLLVNINSGVKLNNKATVVTANVAASNGVVHVIDKVLTLPTVVTKALDNPAFSSLVAALTRPDLGVDYVTLLSAAGPFTVFAPTNDAFTALLTELKLTKLADIPAATLNAVLQYHVVSGANVVSTQLTQNQEVTTFGTGKFKIDLVGGAKITDAKGRQSKIIIADVQADNGVVHAIDKVILP